MLVWLSRWADLLPTPQCGARCSMGPLVTLGTSSARLSARSRDDRLSTLRLLGLSARRVRNLAVAESALVQSIGVLLGCVRQDTEAISASEVYGVLL